MTLDDNEGAFVDGLGGWLASQVAGAKLDASFATSEAAKAASKQAVDLVKDHQKEYAKLSGLQNPPADWVPIFLPYHLCNPTLKDKGSFDETKIETWGWDKDKNTNSNAEVTLDALGFAIYAEALLAEEQLVDRSVKQGDGTTVATLIGRSELSGFLAFSGLECACAALAELREKLYLDSRDPSSPKLGKCLRAYGPPGPDVYDKTGGDKKKTYFPHSVKAAAGANRVEYAAADKKSNMFDQAALLLGVCELAKASEGKNGVGRFFNSDKPLFDKTTCEKAVETAVLLFMNWGALHFNGDRAWVSFANHEGIIQPPIVLTKDDGLMLCALESFVSLKWDPASPLGKKLQEEQEPARNDLLKIAAELQTYQTNSQDGGFCDKYDVGAQAPIKVKDKEPRPLAAQGFAIQGLVAVSRAMAANPQGFAKATKVPPVRDMAQKTVGYLETQRWEPGRGLYLDDLGQPRAEQALDTLDAAAVLGGLRSLAQETKDVRYLLRYKSFLATLRAAGIPLAQTSHGAALPAGARTVGQVGYAPVAQQTVKLK